MSVPGVNLIYLLLGDSATGGVNFYFGFARDENAVNKATDSVNELGNAFIKPALLGNFRGSSVHEIKGEEIENIHNTIVEYMKGSCEALVGVPGWVKEKDKQDFRGIDRLVDVMQGDEFGFMIIRNFQSLGNVSVLHDILRWLKPDGIHCLPRHLWDGFHLPFCPGICHPCIPKHIAYF